MERNKIDKEFGISLSQDCKRGACLSCSTKVVNFEEKQICFTTDDSLNDLAAKELRDKGFILPCSTYPLSDLILDIEANELAWKYMFRDRLPTDHRAAIAKSIRKKCETNKNQFVQELEKEWKSDNLNER